MEIKKIIYDPVEDIATVFFDNTSVSIKPKKDISTEDSLTLRSLGLTEDDIIHANRRR